MELAKQQLPIPYCLKSLIAGSLLMLMRLLAASLHLIQRV